MSQVTDSLPDTNDETLPDVWPHQPYSWMNDLDIKSSEYELPKLLKMVVVVLTFWLDLYFGILRPSRFSDFSFDKKLLQ